MKPQSQQPKIQEFAELSLREQGVQPCCQSSWPTGATRWKAAWWLKGSQAGSTNDGAARRGDIPSSYSAHHPALPGWGRREREGAAVHGVDRGRSRKLGGAGFSAYLVSYWNETSRMARITKPRALISWYNNKRLNWIIVLRPIGCVI